MEFEFEHLRLQVVVELLEIVKRHTIRAVVAEEMTQNRRVVCRLVGGALKIDESGSSGWGYGISKWITILTAFDALPDGFALFRFSN